MITFTGNRKKDIQAIADEFYRAKREDSGDSRILQQRFCQSISPFWGENEVYQRLVEKRKAGSLVPNEKKILELISKMRELSIGQDSLVLQLSRLFSPSATIKSIPGDKIKKIAEMLYDAHCQCMEEYEQSLTSPLALTGDLEKFLREPGRFQYILHENLQLELAVISDDQSKILYHQSKLIFYVINAIEKAPENLFEPENVIETEAFGTLRERLKIIMSIQKKDKDETKRVLSLLEKRFSHLDGETKEHFLAREKQTILLMLYRERKALLNQEKQKPIDEIKKIEEKEEESLRIIQESSQALNRWLFDFCERNNVMLRDPIFAEVSQQLSVGDQSIRAALKQAENVFYEKLTWSEWFQTTTFNQRLRSGIAGLLGGGGIAAVAAIPLAFVAPVAVGLVGAAGAVAAAYMGFCAPEVQNLFSDKAEAVQEYITGFFIAERSALQKEFISGKGGISEKYQATERMRRVFGELPAEQMAIFYANFLFKLQLEISHGSATNQQKEEWKKMYLTVLRNYQMLRGEDAGIRDLYRNQTWGAETAEVCIRKSKEMGPDELSAIVKKDLAVMHAINQEAYSTLRVDAFHAFTDLHTLMKKRRVPLEVSDSHHPPQLAASPVSEAPSNVLAIIESPNALKHFSPEEQVRYDKAVVLAKRSQVCETKIRQNEEDLMKMVQICTPNKELNTQIRRSMGVDFTYDPTAPIEKIVEDFSNDGNYLWFKFWIESNLSGKTAEEIRQMIFYPLKGLEKSIFEIWADDRQEGGEICSYFVRQLREKASLEIVDCIDFTAIQDKRVINNDNLTEAIGKILSEYKPNIKYRAEIQDFYHAVIESYMPELSPMYGILCNILAEAIEKKESTKSVGSWWNVAGQALSLYSQGETREDLYDKLLGLVWQFVNTNKTQIFKEGDCVNELESYLLGKMGYLKGSVEISREKLNIQPGSSSNFEKKLLACGLPEKQKKIFEYILKGNLDGLRLLYADVKLMLSSNIKVAGKNLLWIAVEENRPDIMKFLYENGPSSSRSPCFDDAGPEGSVFTFAASRNRACYEAMQSASMVARTKGYSRFLPDRNGNIALHYLLQNGSVDDCVSFLKLKSSQSIDYTEERRWMHQPSITLEAPLTILLRRQDACDIVQAFNKETPYGFLHLLKSTFSEKHFCDLLVNRDDVRVKILEGVCAKAIEHYTNTELHSQLIEMMKVQTKLDKNIDALLAAYINCYQKNYTYIAADPRIAMRRNIADFIDELCNVNEFTTPAIQQVFSDLDQGLPDDLKQAIGYERLKSDILHRRNQFEKEVDEDIDPRVLRSFEMDDFQAPPSPREKALTFSPGRFAAREGKKEEKEEEKKTKSHHRKLSKE